MMKDFLKENTHLRISIQHLGLFGGGFEVKVHNTTHDILGYIFRHFITDEELESLNVDFETAIMTPIVNWWKETNPMRGNRQ